LEGGGGFGMFEGTIPVYA